MNTKETYRQHLQEKLNKWNNQISELKEKADHAADPDAKEEFNGQVEEIHALQQAALSKLQELQAAEDSNWGHLEEGIEHAWEKLESAVKRFIALYKEP